MSRSLIQEVVKHACVGKLKPNDLFLTLLLESCLESPVMAPKNLLIYSIFLYKPNYCCHYSFQCINIFSIQNFAIFSLNEIFYKYTGHTSNKVD